MNFFKWVGWFVVVVPLSAWSADPRSATLLEGAVSLLRSDSFHELETVQSALNVQLARVYPSGSPPALPSPFPPQAAPRAAYFLPAAQGSGVSWVALFAGEGNAGNRLWLNLVNDHCVLLEELESALGVKAKNIPQPTHVLMGNQSGTLYLPSPMWKFFLTRKVMPDQPIVGYAQELGIEVTAIAGPPARRCLSSLEMSPSGRLVLVKTP